MNNQYQQLFECWCVPYQNLQFQLRDIVDDPIKAYGIYAFEEGFKLALNLAAPLLTQYDFDPHRYTR